MLFNLFGKKEDENNDRLFKDMVWIDSDAKMQGLLQVFKTNPDTLFVGWFAEAISQFRAFGALHGIPENQVKEAHTLRRHDIAGRHIVFLEHHPLHAKEIKLAEELQLGVTEVHGAMDEPIFVRFGSEKMLPLVKLLGFKASEPITHPYVTASVIKAQQKMAQQVQTEQPAASLSAWLEKNLK